MDWISSSQRPDLFVLAVSGWMRGRGVPDVRPMIAGTGYPSRALARSASHAANPPVPA
jgi:hypothetical protein